MEGVLVIYVYTYMVSISFKVGYGYILNGDLGLTIRSLIILSIFALSLILEMVVLCTTHIFNPEAVSCSFITDAEEG